VEKEVKPEEKIEIREESEVAAAPVEAPAAPEQPVKAEEANDGEETFSIAAAPKKVVKEEVWLDDTW
jgi:hypothetical protein